MKAELARREPSVIIAKRPCVLLENKKPDFKYYVEEEKCTSCRLCIRSACSGISFDEDSGKAYFNYNNCVCCGLCPEICTFDAIKTVPN